MILTDHILQPRFGSSIERLACGRSTGSMAASEGIDKPVVGSFSGTVGQFYNDDVLGGRPIRVRFTYRDLGPDRACWDQAFSPDMGRSWEVNWTMDFARAGA